jgi:hypothetical protein
MAVVFVFACLVVGAWLLCACGLSKAIVKQTELPTIDPMCEGSVLPQTLNCGIGRRRSPHRIRQHMLMMSVVEECRGLANAGLFVFWVIFVRSPRLACRPLHGKAAPIAISLMLSENLIDFKAE